MKVPHVHALYVHGASIMHRADARTKILALLGFATIVAATPRTAVALQGVEAAVVTVVVLASSMDFRLVAARLTLGLPFAAFAVLLPFVGVGPRAEFGPLSLSIAGCWAAWGLLAKGTLCLVGAIVLTTTTTVPDLLIAMTRLRVPTVIVMIAGFMLRYLDVIGLEWSRMRRAMTARGFAPRGIGDARPLANGAGALFVRAHERGERVYGAMLARGFTEDRQ